MGQSVQRPKSKQSPFKIVDFETFGESHALKIAKNPFESLAFLKQQLQF